MTINLNNEGFPVILERYRSGNAASLPNNNNLSRDLGDEAICKAVIVWFGKNKEAAEKDPHIEQIMRMIIHEKGTPRPTLEGLPEPLADLINENHEWSDKTKVLNALTQPGVLATFNAWKKNHEYEMTFDALHRIDLTSREIREKK